MGLSTTYTKVETDFLIQQLEKKTASGYKGDLNKTEAAPTEVGFYGLLETGVYTNLGGINATTSKLNFASFDGTTWSLIAVDMPENSIYLPTQSNVYKNNTTTSYYKGVLLVDFYLSNGNNSDIYTIDTIGYHSNKNVYVQLGKNGAWFADIKLIKNTEVAPTGIKEFYYKSSEFCLRIIIDFDIINTFNSVNLVLKPKDIKNIPDFFGIDPVDNLRNTLIHPLSVINRDFNFAGIFLKWGFIGDSLSSGEHEIPNNGNTIYRDIYDYSWGQFMCRQLGVTGYNFSYGGQTARNWNNDLVSERGWGMARTLLQQAYIIALTTNDATSYPLGTTSDIDVSNFENNNNNTFYGAYAGIIQRIKSVNPNAYFFLATKAIEGRDYEEPWNVAVRNICNMFPNCFLLDFAKYAPEFKNIWNERYRKGYHHNASGYLYESWMYMTYIDYIIRENYGLFVDVAIHYSNMPSN